MTRYCLALIAVLAALFVPTTASADWLPVEEVGRIEPSDQEIRMASNDRADAVVLWRDSRGIQVSVSRRGGPFGPARLVPGSEGGLASDVLLNEDGRALIHWRVFSAGKQRAYIAGLKVDGGFGTTRRATPAAEYLTFYPTIGPGGRFAFLYSTGDRLRPVYARVAPPSGKLGPRSTFASGAITPRDLYYVGNTPYAAYTQASEDHGKLRERRIGAGGSSRALATVPKRGIVEVDTASNGMQAAVWTTGNTDGPERPLVAATRRPGQAFKGQQLEVRVPPQHLAIAIARSGAATVAWGEWNESTTEDDPSPTPQYSPPGTIVTSYRPPNGRFGPLGSFRPDPEPAHIQGLAADIDTRGAAVLTYAATRFAGIQGRFFVTTQREGGHTENTAMTDFNEGGGPGAEINVKGRAVVAWISDRRIRARRGDLR